MKKRFFPRNKSGFAKMKTVVISFLVGFFPLFNTLYGHERIDLSKNQADLTIIPPGKTANFGWSLSCGDVNGDGVEDLIIGIPYYNDLGEPLGGKVYLVYGNSFFPDTLDIKTFSGAFSLIMGPDSIDIGRTVKCRDINGDGIDDILIGAPGASPLGRRGAGSVYIIYGKKGGFLPEWNLDTTPPDELIFGREEGDALGISLAVGDLNNDGFQDIIMGAYKARRPDSTQYLAGSVFSILNTENPPAVEDLAQPVRCIIQIAGVMTNDYCGWATASGDLNGDKFKDILIGAYKVNTKLPLTDQGEAYIVFGRHSFPKAINIGVDSVDVRFKGSQFQEHMAYSVAMGDFNGDKLDDVVLGSRQASPDEVNRSGRLRVVYGNSSMPRLIDFGTVSPALDIFGELEGGMLGSAIATGDVNADGFEDILAGAPFSEFNVPTPPGKAYLFLGGAKFSGVWDLKERPADLAIVGADSSDNLGTSLACGDINGDGYDDIIVAAPGEKPNGAVYVLWGQEITGVNDFQRKTFALKRFRLYQNYPNPFNGKTDISYYIPQNSHITLTIIDLLGRELKLLVDKDQAVGVHSILWDGRDRYGRKVSSGIYICRIEAVGSFGNFIQTRKMIFME